MTITKVCWHNGKFVKEPVMISSGNYSLHYGPVVWEGIRCYTQFNGKVKVMKLREHVGRLFDSLRALDITVDFKQADITAAIEDLVKKNNMKDGYIRPVVYNSGDYAGLQQDKKQYNFDIYITEMGKTSEEGIKVITSSYQRSYPSILMQCKAASNYMLGQLAEEEAARAGASDALLTDKNGFYTESSVGNLFIVKDGVVMTPPSDGSILHGITRSCVIHEILGATSVMFTKYNMATKVVNKNITRIDLYTADEIFLCGTFMEITPVIEIDGRKLEVGLITNIVKTEYQRMIRNC